MNARQRSAFTSPLLVGAVTVLAVLVAVFLAYNANQGLPFVPTRQLKVDIADGANLVAGNDVREGGFRIGLVSSMRPVQLPNGQVGAQLILQLDQAHGRVPVDSTASIQPKSLLGLKYVELSRGISTQVYPDGAVMPVTHTTVPVQFDDILGTFDTRTRAALQQNLVGFGDALTGRGPALNDTIGGLPQLLGHLEPVARYLSEPTTQLTRLLRAVNAFVGTVAPVANVAAKLFTDSATTFESISRNPRALESTISESPSTLAVSTDSLRAQQSFLGDLTTLGTNLTPASAELSAALPDINPAIEAGTATLARTPALDAHLQQVLAALKSLAQAPGTDLALNALTGTVDTLNPMIRYLGPYVTVCDTWNYWWTFLAEHLSEQTNFGFAQRVLLNLANPLAPNSVGAQGASEPANGGGSAISPLGPLLGGNQFLHAQSYGAAIDNRGNADCEAGQRGYPNKLNYFDPQGRNLALDAHTPGNQGPNFHGASHVPRGETFTRNPQTGPQLPSDPSNP